MGNLLGVAMGVAKDGRDVVSVRRPHVACFQAAPGCFFFLSDSEDAV